MIQLPPGREHQLIAPYTTDLHGSARYPFAAMEVGDYFVIDYVTTSKLASIRQCATGWAKRRGLDRKFSIRRIPKRPGQPPSCSICVRVR